MLLDNGACIDIKQTDNNTTALHLAVKEANHQLVAFLTQHQCKVNERDVYGNTPIMIAMEARDTEIIKLLEESGAKVEGVEGSSDLLGLEPNQQQQQQLHPHHAASSSSSSPPSAAGVHQLQLNHVSRTIRDEFGKEILKVVNINNNNNNKNEESEGGAAAASSSSLSLSPSSPSLTLKRRDEQQQQQHVVVVVGGQMQIQQPRAATPTQLQMQEDRRARKGTFGF